MDTYLSPAGGVSNSFVAASGSATFTTVTAILFPFELSERSIVEPTPACLDDEPEGAGAVVGVLAGVVDTLDEPQPAASVPRPMNAAAAICVRFIVPLLTR